MKHLFALAFILLAATSAHADAVGEAQALFDQGITDLKAGRLDDACKELGASLAKHSDSGTKGALATCFTKQGKLASAWQLWRDLADTESISDLRTDAATHAAELQPRLPRYTVTVQGGAIAGLVVTVNGDAIDLSVSVPLPVDPGPVAVTAHAPDHDDWSHSFDAAEGKVTAIDVPALVAHPVAHDTSSVYKDGAPRPRRRLAAGIGIGGGAVVIAGAVFGGLASSKFSTVKSECGGSVSDCPGDTFAQAQKDFNSAGTLATTSDALFIIGGAAVIGAAVLWFTAPTEKLSASAPLTLAPTVTPHGGGGLVLSGAW